MVVFMVTFGVSFGCVFTDTLSLAVTNLGLATMRLILSSTSLGK